MSLDRFHRSRLWVDGNLVADNEGLHGMVERCGSRQLSTGEHLVYLEGFQAGGGVGMELKYAGPDTRGRKVFMRSDALPAMRESSSQYYPKCDPTVGSAGDSGLTLCMFRSVGDLARIPSLASADQGWNRLYFVGKAKIPSIDFWSLEHFRRSLPQTPDANYAWAMYGTLQIGAAGSYTMCITSDDGSVSFSPRFIHNVLFLRPFPTFQACRKLLALQFISVACTAADFTSINDFPTPHNPWPALHCVFLGFRSFS